MLLRNNKPLLSILRVWQICFFAFACCFGMMQSSAKIFTPHYPDFFEQYLKQDRFSIDTGADAVILYEKADFAIIIGGSQYMLRKRIRKVIKVLAETGKYYGDINESAYYDDEKTTDFSELSGVTYNWRNGTMTEDKLVKGTATYEVTNDYLINLKFSMPGVQVGSIIDYQYTIEEPLFYSLGTAYFRERIPIMYCEVNLDVPAKYEVTCMLHGTIDFKEYDDSKNNDELSIPQAYRYTKKANEISTLSRWVVRDVRGLHDEPYVANIKNYFDEVSFQVGGFASEFGSGWDKFDSWEKLDAFYENDEKFMKKIKPNAGYIRDILPKIVGKDTGRLQQAKLIYKYVRDSFQVVQNSATKPSLKQVTERKSGNEKDLNLLFQSLLQAANIPCKSIVLSTTKNVKLTKIYPVIDNINYLATLVHIYDSDYVADPSEKYNPFGILNPNCYNGYTRIIDADGPSAIMLTADQLVDRCRYVVYTISADADNYVIGIKQYFGVASGALMRRNIAEDTANLKKIILKELPPHADLIEYKAENLNDIDDRLVFKYNVKMPWKEAAVYMCPEIVNQFSENPFKSMDRLLPVELPFAVQTVYDVNLKLPERYKLMDTVRSIQYNLGDQNKYRYIAELLDSTHTLRVNTMLLLKQTYFDPTEYGALKSFFDKMLELQQTPYYFKKL